MPEPISSPPPRDPSPSGEIPPFPIGAPSPFDGVRPYERAATEPPGAPTARKPAEAGPVPPFPVAPTAATLAPSPTVTAAAVASVPFVESTGAPEGLGAMLMTTTATAAAREPAGDGGAVGATVPDAPTPPAAVATATVNLPLPEAMPAPAPVRGVSAAVRLLGAAVVGGGFLSAVEAVKAVHFLPQPWADRPAEAAAWVTEWPLLSLVLLWLGGGLVLLRKGARLVALAAAGVTCTAVLAVLVAWIVLEQPYRLDVLQSTGTLLTVFRFFVALAVPWALLTLLGHPKAVAACAEEWPGPSWLGSVPAGRLMLALSSLLLSWWCLNVALREPWNLFGQFLPDAAPPILGGPAAFLWLVAAAGCLRGSRTGWWLTFLLTLGTGWLIALHLRSDSSAAEIWAGFEGPRVRTAWVRHGVTFVFFLIMLLASRRQFGRA